MDELCATLSRITLPLESFYLRNREFLTSGCANKVRRLDKMIFESPLHHKFLNNTYCDIPKDKYIYKQVQWKNNYVVFSDDTEYFYREPKTLIYNSPAKEDLSTIDGFPFADMVFVVSSIRDLIVLEAQRVPAVFVTTHTIPKLINNKKELVLVHRWNSGLYNEIRQKIQNEKIKAWTIWDKSSDLFDLLRGIDCTALGLRPFWNKLKTYVNDYKQEILLSSESIFDDSLFLQESVADTGYRISMSSSSEKSYLFTNFIIKYIDFSNDENGAVGARVDIYLRNKAIIRDVILPMDTFTSLDRFKCFFYSLSPEILINNVKKHLAPIILERLRELILSNSKPIVRRKLARMGYNSDLRASVYPNWSSMGSSSGGSGNSILASFDFAEVATADFPDLCNVNAKAFDENFTELIKELFRSMGYDPESALVSIVGPMLFAWALSTYYLPFIMRDLGKFPQMNMYGSAKRGKTFNSILLSLAMGLRSPKLSPATTTIAGFSRLMNMYTNGFLVLDEFTKKSTPNEKIYDAFVSLIRSTYDGSSRILGSKSDNTSISKIQMGIPVLMIGESLVEDNALRSRSICMQVENPALTNVDANYSEHVQDIAKQLRPYMKYFVENISECEWTKYYQQIQIIRNKMRKANTFMESRDVDVWSIPIPFARPFFQTEKEYKKFISMVIGEIQDAKFIMQQDDVFTVISDFAQLCLHDKFKNDYMFKENCKLVFGSNKFYFSPTEIYNAALLYEKQFGVRNVVISSSETFREILRKKPYYIGNNTMNNYNNKKVKMYAIDWMNMPSNTLMYLIQLHCYVTEQDLDEVTYATKKKRDLTIKPEKQTELPQDEEEEEEEKDESDPFLDAIDEYEF